MGKKTKYKFTKSKPQNNKFVYHLGFCENKKEVPFKEGMYDFYIFEIDKYKGNFYIFPEKYLIDNFYIQTKKCSGKIYFYILEPNIKENNWSLDYLNKFDQFKT